MCTMPFRLPPVASSATPALTPSTVITYDELTGPGVAAPVSGCGEAAVAVRGGACALVGSRVHAARDAAAEAASRDAARRRAEESRRPAGSWRMRAPDPW